MATNIFQQRIVPVVPKVLSNERVYVYVPKATKNTPGIASFVERDFNVDDGKASLIWPMQMDVEQLADPTLNISRIKVLDDEFESTGNEASVTNPLTGTKYTSRTAEVQLNRKNRNAFVRPDLVMLDNTSDFQANLDPDTGYVKYTLQHNNPLVKPSLVKADNNDFLYEDGKLKINWPYAHNASGSNRTNGFGLVKILPNSEGGLKFTDNGELEVDFQKVNKAKPTYGADATTGFTDYDQYVDKDGYSLSDDNGYLKLAITKEAVGLSKVENKAFNEYTYDEFSSSFKNTINTMLDTRLPVTTWNTLFGDWNPPTELKNTPQKWFTVLDQQDEAIWESITSLKTFLGFYNDLSDLQAAHPASNITFGSTAFLLDTQTYWATRTTNVNYMVARDEDLDAFVKDNKDKLKVNDKIGVNEDRSIYIWNGQSLDLSEDKVQYEWYNTQEGSKELFDYMETNAKAYRPDGTASAGTSGKWAQSDHIHPTDTTRLGVDTFNTETINVTSELGEGFSVKLDATNVNRTLNIPYIRKAQSIHNYNGQTSFVDTEESSENYWRGTEAEFLAQINQIKNNSICMVDEDEANVAGEIITPEELDTQGITIDNLHPNEKFVIVESDTTAQDLVDRPLTLTRVQNADGNYRYKLSAMQLTDYSVGGYAVVSKLVGNKNTFTIKPLTANTLVSTDENGALASGSITLTAVLATSKGGSNTILDTGKLLQSKGDNIVEVKDFGTVANKLIITDGLGNIGARSSTNAGTLLVTGENGVVSETGYAADNVLVTSYTTTEMILPADRLLISDNGNTVTTMETTTKGKVIIADGNGCITESDIAAGKLVYTSAAGVLAALPMQASDAGKVVAVDSTGSPTLVELSQPNTLPITTYTSDPGNNVNGMVLCKLNADPGTYSDGVIYMF